MHTLEKLIQVVKVYFRNLLGQNGHVVITSSYTGNDKFSKICTLESTVIDYVDNFTGNSVSTLTLPANFEIVGSITNVDLTSGSLIAYYA